MAAGEEIEEATTKKKKGERSFLHCETERDAVHRLQSIHITLLGKNIIPDETQQLTTSPQSQCRVLPAPLELPSGSCQQQGWCFQPRPLSPAHHAESLTAVTQDGFWEMSSRQSGRDAERRFPPALCSKPAAAGCCPGAERIGCCSRASPKSGVLTPAVKELMCA